MLYMSICYANTRPNGAQRIDRQRQYLHISVLHRMRQMMMIGVTTMVIPWGGNCAMTKRYHRSVLNSIEHTWAFLQEAWLITIVCVCRLVWRIFPLLSNAMAVMIIVSNCIPGLGNWSQFNSIFNFQFAFANSDVLLTWTIWLWSGRCMHTAIGFFMVIQIEIGNNTQRWTETLCKWK